MDFIINQPTLRSKVHAQYTPCPVTWKLDSAPHRKTATLKMKKQRNMQFPFTSHQQPKKKHRVWLRVKQVLYALYFPWKA